VLRVSFNLDDADLQHFAEVAQQTQAMARQTPEEAIIAAAREVLEKSSQSQVAEFVKERYSRLRSMIDMVVDPDWQLGAEDRQRLINALACFGAPSTTAGAGTTGGMLDHAIMIELVSRDLQHDLEAYADFCRFRDSQVRKRADAPTSDREQWLGQRRAALQERMHARRQRDLSSAGSAVRKLFSLFGL
jgi:hypothetical protein